jgi:quinol monooxygenase YgiN
MIQRIVKMTFQADKVSEFVAVFDEKSAEIRNFEGCHQLLLLRAADAPIFFTYSYWENEAALALYRQSDLFRTTWAKTKVLFAAPPEAWTLHIEREFL